MLFPYLLLLLLLLVVVVAAHQGLGSILLHLQAEKLAGKLEKTNQMLHAAQVGPGDRDLDGYYFIVDVLKRMIKSRSD